MKRICFLLVFCLFSVFQTYSNSESYYVSNQNNGNPKGSDNNPGTSELPFQTLKKVQQLLNEVNSTDTLFVYFDRGDEWDASKPLTNARGGAVNNWSSKQDAVLRITQGIVIFDAYGAGPKPVLQGPITTWKTNPRGGSGRHKTDNIISLDTDGCQILNLEIRGHFANGIGIREGSGKHIIRHCYIHNMGGSGICNQGPGDAYGTSENIVEYNEFAYLQREHEFGYRERWGNGIRLNYPEGDFPNIWGNQIRYNYVHHIFGEGIATGVGKSPEDRETVPTIVEYNIVANTKFAGLHPAPKSYDLGLAYVRHNLVFITKEFREYVDSLHGDNTLIKHGQGVIIMDEYDGGNNTEGEMHIYGNIIAGNTTGIWMCTSCEDNSSKSAYGKIYIYNNTIIDCFRPVLFRSKNHAIDGKIFNNSIILYDYSSHEYVIDQYVSAHNRWGIWNNHFFGSNKKIPAPWNESKVEGDPKLGKNSGWSSLDRLPSLSDFYPQAGSVLVDSGINPGNGFKTDALTYGTDFLTLPDSATFALVNRPIETAWDIGAVETQLSTGLDNDIFKPNNQNRINIKPNPSSNHTRITFQLLNTSQNQSGIPVKILNSHGQMVCELLAEKTTDNQYQCKLDSGRLHSGFYTAVVKSHGVYLTEKLLVTK